ncbi:MAG: hypothetical protein LBQ90_01875 [Synergistaceae bacterium]|nr:hypothetical protein [Synergistaceae bacterium]
MWARPDSEDLLPYFMQEATGFFKALALYFGIPVLTTCMLLYHQGVSFSLTPVWYGHTLRSIFTSQNLFYLIHLIPALGMRFFARRRFEVNGALVTALLLDLLALLVVYPVRSIRNPANLKNILMFISPAPVLMVFFTLRMYRLRISGGIVIVVFLALLGWQWLKWF